MKFFLVLNVACSLFYVAFTATIPLHKKPLDPDHVPSDVCQSMLPHHNGTAPSASLPPYAIITSKAKASPGEIVEVLAKGIDGHKFRGLYMQARVLGSGVEAVGKFVAENLQVNSAVRIPSCPPGSENAISYISFDEIGELQLKWRVPEGLSGKIYFRGTFVKSFRHFWMNVDSNPIEILA